MVAPIIHLYSVVSELYLGAAGGKSDFLGLGTYGLELGAIISPRRPASSESNTESSPSSRSYWLFTFTCGAPAYEVSFLEPSRKSRNYCMVYSPSLFSISLEVGRTSKDKKQVVISARRSARQTHITKNNKSRIQTA